MVSSGRKTTAQTMNVQHLRGLGEERPECQNAECGSRNANGMSGKLIAVFLSVVLVIGLLPSNAIAESGGDAVRAPEVVSVAGSASDGQDASAASGATDASQAQAPAEGSSSDEHEGNPSAEGGASAGVGEGTEAKGDGAATPDGELSLAAAAAQRVAQESLKDEDGDDEAAESELAPLSQDVSAAWPNFRGNAYNNGIVNYDIPTSADEARLLWRLRLGEGWSNAPSTQLIVDGCLIVMAATTIYKVDLGTGSILAQGTLYDKFNWGYTPFAYGEGKIFVSLASGKVQALDATTLESLWVYSDPLKGQSVSPVVYSDGYVYTGFWNSYKKNANYVCLKAEDEDRTQATEAKEAVWSITNAGGYYWAGAVAVGDYLIFGCDDGKNDALGTSQLRCVNKYTGEIASTLALEGLGDQRSSICYVPELGKLFFTARDSGSICSASINPATGQLSNLATKQVWEGAQSTSTPVYYKGKLYFGIGAGFNGGDFCRFVVADASTLDIIGSAQAEGDVKASFLLSTATEDSGYLSFYFTCNVKPGGVYVAKVKNDCTSSDDIELATLYDAAGYEEYCISSVIASSDGTLYYKNDSGNVFAVGFTSEGKQAALQRHASAFEQAVDALFPVTIDSGDAIEAARAQEKGLSSAVRALVSQETFDKLTEAEERFAKLGGDKKAADAVTAMIAALFPVTEDSGDAIQQARAAYDALTPSQQEFVSSETLQDLSRAEAQYQALVVDDAAIREIAQDVADLFPVTTESGEAIDAVQDKLDALNVLQMEKVPAEVRSAYKFAKKTYRTLINDKAAADAFIETLLSAFPVTLESGDSLAEARAAYDALTSAQLSFVSSEIRDKLVQAEAEYQKLLDDKEAVDAFVEKVKALFPVTKDSEEAIAAAEKALAALTADQRAQVSQETLQDLQKAKDAFAALPSESDEEDDQETDASGDDASTSGTTRSLGKSKENAVSTSDEEESADETVYTAALSDDSASVETQSQQSAANKIPWQAVLIAAIAFLVGAGVGRFAASGKDDGEDDVRSNAGSGE